jgi:hypothetical protein
MSATVDNLTQKAQGIADKAAGALANSTAEARSLARPAIRKVGARAHATVLLKISRIKRAIWPPMPQIPS